MKLISVVLHGYKRFQQRSSMNVDGKLVAVVGPNESGKSSFLDALVHLNHRGLLVTSGGSQETTRNETIPSDQDVIQAKYLLDDQDREALAGIPEGDKVRWFLTGKRAVGTETLFCGLIPTPRRSLEPRRGTLHALNETMSREDFRGLADEQEGVDLLGTVQNLVFTLGADSWTLPGEAQDEIRSVTAVLENLMSGDEPAYLQQVTKQLKDLADHEMGDPEQQAMNILVERRPEALLFTDDHRLLQPEYDLNTSWEDSPAALRNLADLAGLDLERLYIAATANDHATVSSLEEQANQRLKQAFEEAWSQSDAFVGFRVNGMNLHVQVREPRARYSSIAERSDGLRQFVALVAFASKQPSQYGRFLLIDEAETHLHYDAQADLVQMLARQNIVTKVIYTTHSIGCLPEDLGAGVRFIESLEPESFTSRIENAFWTDDGAGFASLLFGMGASTLAFIPLRDSVVGEGPSDMILWPTLFREATGRTYLDLQVVPGLSEVDRPGIIVLDRQAPRTTYLLDSDEGGDALHTALTSAGIPEDRIFHISDDRRAGLVLEDLVDGAVYIQAVNEELRRSHGPKYSIPAERVPNSNRPAEVEAWCRENSIPAPKKTAVAYRVLEIGIENSVLADAHRESVRSLFEAISNALPARRR